MVTPTLSLHCGGVGARIQGAKDPSPGLWALSSGVSLREVILLGKLKSQSNRMTVCKEIRKVDEANRNYQAHRARPEVQNEEFRTKKRKCYLM